MATLPMPRGKPPGSPAPGVLAGAAGTVPLPVLWTCFLAVLGTLSLWPAVLMLWSLWTTDPLKSIGGFIPLISLLLVLRTWHACGWVQRGSWWGLGLVALTIAAVQLRAHALLELVVTRSWSLMLPPLSLVALAYGSGLVLLVGGTRLWRASLFPLLLLLLVNPVPHVFSRLVDLPLQHASAHIARGLAHALGQRLTPDQLYLMFTPDFGMFIAPGCNGIRGSITLGLIALVAGYLYRFPLRLRVLAVVAAVLLGYLFNLLRLCVLVLYYVAALHWQVLQPHAEMGDYCIGATLFFGAAMLFFAGIRRFSPGGELRLPPPTVLQTALPGDRRGTTLYARLTVLSCQLLLGAVPAAWGMLRPRGAQESLAAAMPMDVGPYHLQKTWLETLDTGVTIFRWAEYARPGHLPAVQVGISPNLGAHDALLCHVARGDEALWQGPLSLKTANGSTAFTAALYQDGATPYLEASTLCTPTGCGQFFAAGPRHLGLVWSPLKRTDLSSQHSQPVPLLLRAELPQAALAAGEAQNQLTEALRDFSAYASFDAFSYRYPHP